MEEKYKLQSLGIVAFISLILGLTITLVVYKNTINVIYFGIALLALRWLYVSPKFVSNYARLLGYEPKVHWYIPVITEHAIFSRLFSRLANITFAIFFMLLLFVILVHNFEISIPFSTDATADTVITNIIWITILVGNVYNLVVALGYYEIDRYISREYFKVFNDFSQTYRKVGSNWATVTYLFPVVRLVAQNDANNRMEKIMKFKEQGD